MSAPVDEQHTDKGRSGPRRGPRALRELGGMLRTRRPASRRRRAWPRARRQGPEPRRLGTGCRARAAPTPAARSGQHSGEGCAPESTLPKAANTSSTCSSLGFCVMLPSHRWREGTISAARAGRAGGGSRGGARGRPTGGRCGDVGRCGTPPRPVFQGSELPSQQPPCLQPLALWQGRTGPRLPPFPQRAQLPAVMSHQQRSERRPTHPWRGPTGPRRAPRARRWPACTAS